MSKQKLHRGLALLLACALGAALSGCVIVIPMNGGDGNAPTLSPSPSATADSEESVLAAATSASASSNPTLPDGGIQVGDGAPPASAPEASDASQKVSLPTASAESDEVYPEGMQPTDAGMAASAAEAYAAPGGATLSDQLYSFQVQINGQVFSLPFAYGELAALGWAPREGFDLSLAPNQTSMEKLRMGGQEIYVRFVNTSMDVQSYENCNVGGFIVDEYDVGKGVQFALPQGITIGSSYDQVVAAYGAPSRENQTETLRFMDYSADSYAEISLQLDAATQQVQKIDIKNYFGAATAATTNPTAPDPAAALGPGQAVSSAAVGLYQPPAELSASWQDFILRYGGALYRLPAPVQSFVDNGWVIQSNANEPVAAKQSRVGVELRLDNQVLRTIVHNYDETGQPVSNCYVTQVKSSVYGPSIPLEMAAGVTDASSIEEVLAAYGQPTSTSSSATFDYYSFGTIGERIEINYDREKGKINTIEIDHSPSSLS